MENALVGDVGGDEPGAGGLTERQPSVCGHGLPVRRHLHARVACADAGDGFRGPVRVPRGREPEQLALLDRGGLYPGAVLGFDRLHGPAHDAEPLPGRGCIGDEVREPAALGEKRRAAMECAHAVDEQRPRRYHDLHLVVVDLGPVFARVVRWPQHLLGIVAAGADGGRRVAGGHLGVVEEVGRLPIGRIVRGVGEGVVAVVAVHGLVLVRRMALVLEAQVRLLAEHLAVARHAGRQFDQVRVVGDGVQMRSRKREPVRKHVHGTAPVAPVFGLWLARIAAVLHPAGQKLLPFAERTRNLLLGEKVRDDRVAVFAVVLGVFFCDALQVRSCRRGGFRLYKRAYPIAPVGRFT